MLQSPRLMVHAEAAHCKKQLRTDDGKLSTTHQVGYLLNLVFFCSHQEATNPRVTKCKLVPVSWIEGFFLGFQLDLGF